MTRRWIVVATALFAAAFLAGGAVLYDDSMRNGAGSGQDGGTLVRAHSPVIGPADAPVTIVEFFDPSCEACRAFYPVVKQIMAAFPQETRLVIRYAPFHEGSDEAVAILETARLQGKFEPVLRNLLAMQPDWAVHGAPDLGKAWAAAAEVGLDLAKARADAKSPEIAKILKIDVEDAGANHVEQTPTFFVNGRPLTSFGAQPLYDLVAQEVARVKGGS